MYQLHTLVVGTIQSTHYCTKCNRTHTLSRPHCSKCNDLPTRVDQSTYHLICYCGQVGQRLQLLSVKISQQRCYHHCTKCNRPAINQQHANFAPTQSHPYCTKRNSPHISGQYITIICYGTVAGRVGEDYSHCPWNYNVDSDVDAFEDEDDVTRGFLAAGADVAVSSNSLSSSSSESSSG